MSHTSSSILTQHRWLGTFAAVWTLPLAVLCERAVRRSGDLRRPGDIAPTAAAPARAGRSRLVFQCLLFSGCVLIGVAAHLGGALVYGEEYFQF